MIVTPDITAANAVSHFRSLNARISPAYSRHARYTAIVADSRNAVAPIPWKAEITLHWVSPIRTPVGAVIAITSPTTAIAPTVTRRSVARDGAIFRIRLNSGICI